jgi:hypothetical protein
MPIKYRETKNELGKIDNCWVCEKPINLDGFIPSNRMPDCVICEKGHRIHRTCLDKNIPNHICSYNDCGAEINQNCKSQLGYGYFSTGGKRKTMKTRKTRTNKKKRTKNHKKRNTYKRK